MTDAPDQDEPITLQEACKLRFRNRIKVATLRAEAAKGNLDIFRIGRADFTTLKDLREMERPGARQSGAYRDEVAREIAALESEKQIGG